MRKRLLGMAVVVMVATQIVMPVMAKGKVSEGQVLLPEGTSMRETASEDSLTPLDSPSEPLASNVVTIQPEVEIVGVYSRPDKENLYLGGEDDDYTLVGEVSAAKYYDCLVKVTLPEEFHTGTGETWNYRITLEPDLAVGELTVDAVLANTETQSESKIASDTIELDFADTVGALKLIPRRVVKDSTPPPAGELMDCVGIWPWIDSSYVCEESTAVFTVVYPERDREYYMWMLLYAERE